MKLHELEQFIMDAWQTESDIKSFSSYYQEVRETPASENDWANAMLSLELLHSMRMNRLWNAFEKVLESNR